MSSKEVKFKMIGTFDNMTAKKNGDVDIRFKFPYSELPNYINIFQVLNQNITVGAKVNIEDPMKLGMFTLNSFKVDKDGEATIIFNSSTSYIEHDNVTTVSETSMNKETVTIMCKAIIELDDPEPEHEPEPEEPVGSDDWDDDDDDDWGDDDE